MLISSYNSLFHTFTACTTIFLDKVWGGDILGQGVSLQWLPEALCICVIKIKTWLKDMMQEECFSYQGAEYDAYTKITPLI